LTIKGALWEGSYGAPLEKILFRYIAKPLFEVKTT
jgi:hypothetical protein